MSELPFWAHVEELRKMLIRSGWAILLATLLMFCFHKPLLALVLEPLDLGELYLFTPLEGFATAAKLSLGAGIVISSPFWLYCLLNFLLPALKPREKKILTPFLLFSLVFVAGGIFFGYRITLPFVFSFFRTFNEGLGKNLWSLGPTLDLACGLILAHALVFELYVLLIFLIKMGLFSYALLKKGRKGVIVAIFILAAILTPPDVLSQLLLAGPMYLLFESALLYARLKN
jgi:sec-independent protein translocase protein TatC